MSIILPQLPLPPSISIGCALSLGLIQADVQITNLGTGQPNPTIGYALSSGLINSQAPASTLTFGTNTQYGGQ
jgi:hypothetical protein